MGESVTMKLPPGFRFHPTDEELVAYYLKRKVSNRPIGLEVIAEVDLYKWEPWDLPDKAMVHSPDSEWYFYSPRDKKYLNGSRTNRATQAGYWKATGKDRNVKKGGRNVIGMKKTLVFYKGRAPHGERTDWVMHEYRLEECEKASPSQNAFVLCRVFKKSGPGPRSVEDRGPATYVDDDDVVADQNINEFSKALQKMIDHVPERESKPGGIVHPPAGSETDTSSEQREISSSSVSVLDYQEAVEMKDLLAVEEPEIPVNAFTTTDQDQMALRQGDEDSLFFNYIMEELEPLAEIGLEPTQAPVASASDPVVPQPFIQPSADDAWRAGAQPDAGEEDWNGDCSGIIPQSSDATGNRYFDLLKNDILSIEDDNLPPLVEEQEGQDLNAPRLCMPRVRPLAANEDRFTQHFENSVANCTAEERMPGSGLADSNHGFAVQTSEGMEESQQTVGWASSSGYTSKASSSNVYDPSLASSSWSVSHPEEPSSHDALDLVSYTDSFNTTFEDAYESFADNLPDLPRDGSSFNGTSTFSDIAETHHMETNLDSSSEGQSIARSQVQPAAFDQEPRTDDRKLPYPWMATILKYLDGIPTSPASASEGPPSFTSEKAVHETSRLRDVAPSYNSIHVSAVTVTCTRSADGKQQVQTAVTDCYGDSQGVYQQVVAGTWQSIPDEKGVLQQGLQKRTQTGMQKRVPRGSNSGFVFVFALGLLWPLFLLLLVHVVYRGAKYALTTLF